MSRLPRLALVLALAATATGCKHFRESHKLDMAPFADNTMTSIGELRKYEKPPVWIHLRKYRTLPSVVKLQEEAKPLSRLLRGIGFYSMQMVSIGDSGLSEAKKNAELARYLQVVVREAAADEEAAEWGVTPADIDRVCEDIKKKETFLEGIAAAEPLIDASLRYGLKVLDRLDVGVGEAASSISREVEAAYAEVNANVADVERVQQQLLRGFALLHEYRLGDDKALEKLRASVPLAKEQLAAGKKPSGKDLDAFEAQLEGQLKRVEAARKQLAPDVADYEGSQLELDALRAITVERLRLGRTTMILWARSHRNLGKGIAVPASIDLAGILKSSALGAVKAAIPF
jgi:hypothetical protein